MGGRVAAAVTTTGALLVWGPLLGAEGPYLVPCVCVYVCVRVCVCVCV